MDYGLAFDSILGTLYSVLCGQQKWPVYGVMDPFYICLYFKGLSGYPQ